jgi:alkylation response protein AidB-like acyl-CoA dehydrogenase
MDFELSEEQRAFEESVKKFAAKEIAPGVEQREEKGEFCPDAWRKICHYGLAGLVIPEEYGGSGASALDAVTALIALSEAGRDFSLTGLWATHLLLSAMPIADLGTPEQKNEYLPRMATGDLIGALALTEPNAGSDATGLSTHAVRDGDNYILNGSKTFISNAPIADVFIVVATVDKSVRAGGLTMFIVERNFPGLSTGKPLKKREADSWPTGEVFFDDCRVPAKNLLGEERKGFQYMLQALSWERLAFAPYVGLMATNLFDSIEYSKQRVQFGQPVCNFQLVQAMLAEMKMDLEASRLLTYKLAWKKDQGKDISMDAAVAKTFITEAAERSSHKAIQIFGGNGCMKEYPIGRNLWMSKMGTIGGGTSQVQRTIIGRMLTEH